jgi:RNA polymerase sigma-70 factor (ECF subfamily)
VTSPAGETSLVVSFAGAPIVMTHTELAGSAQAFLHEAGGADFRQNLIRLIPYLRAFARTLTRHRDGADDLCQESLVRAWASRATFVPGSNLKAWLFTILRNQFYSEARRTWRSRPWDDALAERTLVTNASQESAVALSEVARAMQLLGNEQREALILIGASGFTYEEGAKICGCAVGTIKSRVARARQALQATMNGDCKPEGSRSKPLGSIKEINRGDPYRNP